MHHLQRLSALRKLSVSCSGNAFPFGDGDRHFRYQVPVEELDISQWSASGKELTQLLTYFPKLSDLHVDRCEKITGLGVMGQKATATPGTSSSANKSDEQLQQREGLLASEEDGLLLLPPQLQFLGTDDVAGVTAAPICRLLVSSLTKLWIGDKVVERFTELQEILLFVNSLEEITFCSCNNLAVPPCTDT
ncbi:hypothetical protein HU200_039727 [Digitaria exilis]|uniref:Uncharacterized protein n=1 Tax=Digitaria exilis TaxID=1010633 RepID=A0A835EKJ1_9POAL|nr:hypothetical protein HU200_039727 [Digitaria exilis]